MDKKRICPTLFAKSICTTRTCPHQHDAVICEDCDVICCPASTYKAHVGGAGHRNRIRGLAGELYCQLCERIVAKHGWKAHIDGAPHRKAAARQGVGPVVEPDAPPPTDAFGTHYCGLCDLRLLRKDVSTHSRSMGHRKKEAYFSYKAALEDAERDKHGVVVRGDCDYGVVEAADSEKGIVKSYGIETSLPEARIAIVNVNFASSGDERQDALFSAHVDTHTVSYGKPALLRVRFQQRHIGRYQDYLEMVLEDLHLRQRFVIVRRLRAIVGNKADHDELRPRAPYVPRQRTERVEETNALPGVPHPSLAVIPWTVPLPHADIPRAIETALSGTWHDAIGRIRSMFMPRVFCTETYARHFKHLLWVEEIRMNRDLEMYDILDARLQQHLPFYYLKVPGLAEKRPSVLVGDRILVQRQGGYYRWYEGHVHIVRQEEVGLRFHASFKGWTPDQRYIVHFKLNRYPTRRQHQALDTSFSQERLLFPVESHIKDADVPSPEYSRLRMFNKLISDNPAQLQAVCSIAKQQSGGPPIAIFGPPGTGKTVTIVEAIRQILYRTPNARILACAPSNSAADLIAERLTALSPDELFRFYAPSRNKDQVPDVLEPYTARPNVHFSVPTMHRLRGFKVIVSTCVSAGMPFGVGMPRGHFTHIFIDEAGQATEPEVMIPIKTMADDMTKVVLSGDHNQLGPIVRSSIARALGLETSYLERLMKRDIYDEKAGYGMTVVKLVRNFRSHEAILKFPNERFYKGELQQCGDPKDIDAYLGNSLLISKDFPVIFHAISGQDVREASSPSFFNIDEITVVKDYIRKLRANRQVRLTDHDIGVIAPYNAQCQKMRTGLRAFADGVKVGSVEEFQGQERKVIIISTVRSSREFVEYDLKHTLGFVANPRRFNVAVTRAKALLIVVGDPKVLSLDPLWRSFLNYVHTNGGWTGDNISWDPQELVDEDPKRYALGIREQGVTDMNDFARRMESLALAGANGSEEDLEEAEANVDRP